MFGILGAEDPIATSPASGELDLAARCARRAPGAWEELLARYRDGIERAARSALLRGAHAAREDDVEAVVEGVLLALVKDDHAVLRSFQGRSSMAGYFQVITTRIAFNHLRSERRKGWLRFRPLDAAPDAPAQEAEEPPDLGPLRRALEKLPPRDQLILKLFHLDGAGYKEIASILGISLNAVSPALIRARQRIRALLEPDR